MSFALNAALDQAGIAAELAHARRVQIADFLQPDGAELLLAQLERTEEWRHVLNAGDNVYEIACTELAAMDDPQRQLLDRKVDAAAADGFQYRFDTIRVPDEEAARAASGSLLADFASFLSSKPLLDWFRSVTGQGGIDFADCQATRYRPGAFLTRHDDAVEGKQRHFAYVLGLSRDWRAEWGGLLGFPANGAAALEALVPRFNALTLFEVGQPHFVSQVASYAPRPRISVTGWLRAFG